MESIVIRKGKTFTKAFRWETLPFVYKPITAISRAGPVVITAVAHGLPDGWRASVLSVKGMLQINAQNDPPLDLDYHPVTVAGVDNVSLNDIDSSNYKAYTSGGYLRFYTPVDLTGFTARGQIKDKIGGTELYLFTNANGRINIDTVNKRITLTMSAVDSAALAFKTGIFDLELVSAGGVVTGLVDPTPVIIKDEVTTVP